MSVAAPCVLAIDLGTSGPKAAIVCPRRGVLVRERRTVTTLHLPDHWSFGVVGYWYEQLTGDSNNPALLGDFKGRVIGVGPEVSYQFTSSKLHPVTVDLRWYHEFEARNRLEGDGVFLTFSVPLAFVQKPQPAQDWSGTAAQE